ncbi:MAG: hypothetical protein ACRDSZ_16385 [Pseudonocardiaceae bacterium]
MITEQQARMTSPLSQLELAKHHTCVAADLMNVSRWWRRQKVVAWRAVVVV